MTGIPYKNWVSMSDTTLAQQMGNFVKHHRLQQNKTQDSVATAAGISRSTLSQLERSGSVTVPTLIQVLRVLDQLHIMDAFHIEKQISPIMLAKRDEQKRRRARAKKQDTHPESEW